jgi:methyltransferase (TIGR00027 family)
MRKNQSSLTAEGIAYIRARESVKPAGERLFYDPFARHFVAGFTRFFADLFFEYGRRRSPGVPLFLLARTRYLDDALCAAVEQGASQVVILGAGFDARAYRFPAVAEKARVFEVDHPATQAVKLRRLAQVFERLPGHVTFVPIDFNQQNLDELFKHAYLPDQKTFFLWEGVTYYLDPAAVDATLSFIRANSGSGSQVIFDYIDLAALHAHNIYEVGRMKRYRGLTGEGFEFGLERSQVEEFLTSRGFTDIHSAGGPDFSRLYFHGETVSPIYSIVSAVVP